MRRPGRRKADLVRLHWPDKACEDGSLAAVWAALEEAREAGEAGEIGVCNATAAVLRELLKTCRVRPAVNQVERHPLLPQWELLDYCAAEGVAVQAHTPLGAPGGMGKAHRSRLLDHPMRCQMTAIVFVRALGAIISPVELQESRRFHIPVLWEHPLRENTVPIAPCATNAVVNRWAGTNIM